MTKQELARFERRIAHAAGRPCKGSGCRGSSGAAKQNDYDGMLGQMLCWMQDASREDKILLAEVIVQMEKQKPNAPIDWAALDELNRDTPTMTFIPGVIQGDQDGMLPAEVACPSGAVMHMGNYPPMANPVFPPHEFDGGSILGGERCCYTLHLGSHFYMCHHDPLDPIHLKVESNEG